MPGERLHPPHIRRRSTLPILDGLLCALVCLVCVHPQEARAQETAVAASPVSFEAAPPPMRYIPTEERARLREAHDKKARTHLSLELAELRLQRAEQLTTSERFDDASAELGIYQAVLEDAVRFLYETDKVDDKTRDLFKRIDLTLRTHAPRIENIRRSTPSEDAANVRAAYESLRRARTAALNAFYGGAVMHDPTAPAQMPPAAAPPRPAQDSLARLRAAYDLLVVEAKAREAVPELIALLKDEEAFVRGNAAYGLGFLGPEAEAAVPALVRLLKDKNALVRFSAAEAIGKIGLAAVPVLNRTNGAER